MGYYGTGFDTADLFRVFTMEYRSKRQEVARKKELVAKLPLRKKKHLLISLTFKFDVNEVRKKILLCVLLL